MKDDTCKGVLLLTTAEALKLPARARKERARFALHLLWDAPIDGEPDKIFPSGLHTWMDVSNKEARRILGEMLSPTLEARGARIRVRRREYGGHVVYWIG